MVRAFLFFFLLARLLAATPALAQTPSGDVPSVERAEAAFRAGLEAFEAGEYEAAYGRFRQVYESYGLNRKTTAARLMAGKALYRQERYDEAEVLLSDFVRRYPLSSYVGEARETLALARRDRRSGSREPVALGILLPLGGNDAPLTQAMFNGIRLAVDEHNAAPGAVPVRMVFRDSGSDAERAGSALEALAEQEGVAAVIGPLYSRQALAAAAAAERTGVVLVAPLANDDGITEGRELVFQANPTISTRGRQMARYAVRTLGLNRFGVVVQSDRESVSERMAEGFQDEALRLGASVGLYSVLPSESAWSRLPQEISASQLTDLEAVYIPIAGGSAERNARSALDGLEAMDAEVTVLGNSEWHALGVPDKASQFNTTYSADFLVDDSDATLQSFLSRYETLTGQPLPERDRRLPVVGYDVARFILPHLVEAEGRGLAVSLRRAPLFEGLGTRIDFEGGNVNEAMYVLRYDDGAIERLE